MWVKRTEKEILDAKAQPKRPRIRNVMLVSLFAGLMVTFLRGGDWVFHSTSPFVSAAEIPGRLPFSVFAGISAGLIFYLFPPIRRKTFVCPKCGKTKFADSEADCDCGGHFENIETMKWVK